MYRIQSIPIIIARQISARKCSNNQQRKKKPMNSFHWVFSFFFLLFLIRTHDETHRTMPRIAQLQSESRRAIGIVSGSHRRRRLHGCSGRCNPAQRFSLYITACSLLFHIEFCLVRLLHHERIPSQTFLVTGKR